MKTIVTPAGAEVSGNRRLCVLRAVLTPERSVERMQQEIDDQRVGSYFWILQRFAQPGHRHELFIAHRLGDRFFISGFAVRFFVQAAIVGAVQAIAPMADESMRQNPAVITTVAVIVGTGERGENRFQWLRTQGGYRLG